MADMSPFHPEFLPSSAGQVTPPGAPGAPDPGLADRWKNFLGDPASKAALVNFGLQLAQPMGFGQTPMGHVARSIGAGGEAATRAGELDRKDLETESRVMQREAQANAAMSRAQTAEANSNTAAVRAAAAGQNVASQIALREQQALTQAETRRRLEAQTELLYAKVREEPNNAEVQRRYRESQAALNDARALDIPVRSDIRQQDADTRRRGQESRVITDTQRLEQGDRKDAATDERQLRSLWAAEKRAIMKANSDAAITRAPITPIPSFEEWRKTMPSRGGGAASPVPAPQPSQPAPSRPFTQPASAGGGSAIPAAPPPAQRQVNEIYSTPKGPLRWKGNGWEQP